MKSFYFNITKGGCGKTTLTLEIANVFSNTFGTQKVLVIDLDCQRSLSKVINAELEGRTAYDVMTGECPIEDAIQHTEFFDIIVGDSRLAKCNEVFAERDDVFILSDIMELLKDKYDWVFFDAGANRNKVEEMIYAAVDYVVIPTKADDLSVLEVATTETEIDKLVNGRLKISHAKIIGYVLNEYSPNVINNQIAKENVENIAAERKNKTFVATVNKSSKAGDARIMRTCITKMAKSSPIGRQYYDLATNILEVIE